eukprot:1971650-Prymnesium_polylepis.1
MTESSKPPSWDGQPRTLARHIVKLEEDYAEHVSAPESYISSRLAWWPSEARPTSTTRSTRWSE